VKKQYIYFATNDENKAELIGQKLNQLFEYYNCTIYSNAYKRIYDFWDVLDELNMDKQANTLVIFDPAIYKKLPKSEVSDISNYWHQLKTKELYPWYELVLRYPLITPMFFVKNKEDFFEDIKDIDPFCYLDIFNGDIDKQLEKNIALFLNGFRTWFDPFGLRKKWRDRVLRAMFKDELNENKQTPIESRGKSIYCIEDEIEYALFSGYTAYKYGAKVNIVDSYAVLEWSQEKVAKQNSKDVGIIRDLDLRFRDHALNVKDRSSLKKMKNLFPKSSKLDNLVISSHVKISDDDYQIVKPLDSLYKIVERCHMLDIEYKRILIFESEKNKSKDDKNNHAAPYLNMQLSKDILAHTKTSDNSYSNKVFKALLHMEAYMLLGNMAPTTSMQILKDLHLAELDFELSFIGIDKNQTIEDRKKDVENDIERLLRGINNPKLKDSFLISFWNDAKTIYKKHEQFNASEEANNEAMMLIKW